MILILVPANRVKACTYQDDNNAIRPIQRLDGDYALPPSLLNCDWVSDTVKTILSSFSQMEMTHNDFPLPSGDDG